MEWLKEHASWLWGLLGGLLLLLGICAYPLYAGFQFQGDTTVMIFGSAYPINWGNLIWILTGLYALASIRVIPEAHVAGMVAIGIPLIHLESGPAIVPAIIAKVVVFPGTYQQDELPADPEHIFRKEDVETVPPGFFPPNRITFKKKDGTSDPLNRRITAEVPLIVVWKVVNVPRFIKAIGSKPERAIAEARRQMNDTGIAAAVKYLGKNKTAGEALAELEEASDAVDEAITASTKAWGVDIPRAEIKALGFNHALNDAMAKVPEEEYLAQAQAAKGEGIRQYAEKSGLTPEQALGAEVAKAFADGQAVTILVGADGITHMLGVAAAAAKGFKGTTDTKTGGK